MRRFYTIEYGNINFMRKLSPAVIVSLVFALLGVLAFSAAQAQDDPDYRTYVPVGALQMFAGDPLDAPTGWLVADGSCISTVTYAELYGVVGDTFDSCVTPPDGDPAFALPDLRGRVPVGTGAGVALTARTLGDLFGAETHTLTIPEMPAHTHTLARAGGAGGSNPQAAAGTVAGAFTTSSTGGTAGVTQAHNIMQPSIALNFLIWSGSEALVAPEEDIVLTVVVVFPSHTPTPTLTPTMTETPGPSPTPTATATATFSSELVYEVGGQEVLVVNEVTPGDAAIVGLLAAIVGLMLVGFILFWLRRRS